MAYTDLANWDTYQKLGIFYNGAVDLAAGESSTTDEEFAGFYVASDATVTFTSLSANGDTTITALPVYAGGYFLLPLKNITTTGGRILLGKL